MEANVGVSELKFLRDRKWLRSAILTFSNVCGGTCTMHVHLRIPCGTVAKFQPYM